MKKIRVLALILISLLSGCDNAKPSEKPLSCKDNPKGRTQAEQRVIAESCFRSGSFKKSSGIHW